MESLLTLAHQYAARHGTKIISHRITGDQITFILESGPKLTMAPASLQRALEEAGVTPDALSRHSPGLQKDTEASGVTVAELSAPGFSPETPNDSPIIIDPSDGIDQSEASAAGSALAKRRTRKQ